MQLSLYRARIQARASTPSGSPPGLPSSWPTTRCGAGERRSQGHRADREEPVRHHRARQDDVYSREGWLTVQHFHKIVSTQAVLRGASLDVARGENPGRDGTERVGQVDRQHIWPGYQPRPGDRTALALTRDVPTRL